MKKLIILLSLFAVGCSHVKLTHKCNGDKICRCESCDKGCKDCKCK